MSNMHWMPLYIGDYLADTSHLTIEQSGCYLHLLMSQWRVGYVPDDDTKLAALCRVSRTYFARHIGPAVRPFFISDGERLIQVRLEKERKKSAKMSEKQAENARKMHAKKADINDLTSAKAHASTTTKEESKKETEATPLTQASLPAVILTPPPKQVIPDVRSELWAEGLPIIRGLTGKPEGAARGILGKLVKDCRDDCALALGILREARDLRPVGELAAWLTAAAKARADPRAKMHAALAVPNPMIKMISDLEASHRRIQESQLAEGRLLQ